MTTETRPPGLVGGGETGGRPLPTATNKMSGLGLGMVAGMGIGAIVILVVAALALAGLGPNLGGANARMRTAATTEKAAPAAAAVSQAVEVTATEFKFAPAELTLDGAGQLAVTLVNKGLVEHDFVIDGVKVDGQTYAAAGKTVKGTLTFDKPGSYTFYCSIPGHKDAGMKGTLTVGQVAAAAAPAKVQVAPIPAGVKPLARPQVAPPVNRRTPETVKVEVETREVAALMADGVAYTFWTFGGTVPGPMVRVRQGDTVEVTLKNAADSKVTHSIDLHAATGPGGGAKVTQVPPGGSASFSFKALNPGVYVYHCATPMVAHHIASGMYGLIVVEPEAGLPRVDREFYVMQGDFYVKGDRTQRGHHEFSVDKMLDERPDFVVFNGGVGALTGADALTAKVGETVRIFFGVGGPNTTSSFHVIGEIFDRVYNEGGSEPMTNVQTTLVPAGGATVAEFKLEVPGTYALVDHSLGRLEKGGAGHLVVEGPENPDVFRPISPATSASTGSH